MISQIIIEYNSKAVSYVKIYKSIFPRTLWEWGYQSTEKASIFLIMTSLLFEEAKRCNNSVTNVGGTDWRNIYSLKSDGFYFQGNEEQSSFGHGNYREGREGTESMRVRR